MQYISSRTQDLAHLMCWSKDHVLRTTELKEGDVGDELKDREREMCKQKPPLKNSEPAGAQSLTKPGGNPHVNTQNGGRQAGMLPLEAPQSTPATCSAGLTQGHSPTGTSRPPLGPEEEGAFQKQDHQWAVPHPAPRRSPPSYAHNAAA